MVTVAGDSSIARVRILKTLIPNIMLLGLAPWVEAEMFLYVHVHVHRIT